MIDINHDDYYYLIIDLGICGKDTRAICYVYNPNTNQFELLDGFYDLRTPKYIHSLGLILEADHTRLPLHYYYNKYKIDGNKMRIVGALDVSYEGFYPSYTESMLIDGEMVIVKENVPKSEIDLSEWDYKIE